MQDAISGAVIAMGRKQSVSQLLSAKMPAGIQKRVILACPESRFSSISQVVLVKLLNHEDDAVRKAAAIMAVRSLTKARVKAVLEEYVSGDAQRYYNVVHWLDLGRSLSRHDAQRVARSILFE